MKKRILLSLVSFFMMTAMWASLIDAYQIYVTAGANGVAGKTAELTLNMKNRNAIAQWKCDLVLPAGVTFESVAIVPNRYPEGYEADLKYEVKDGYVQIMCEGAEGVTLINTDGAVATVTVKIDAAVAAGDYVVSVKGVMQEPGEDGALHQDEKTREYTWTIEAAPEPQFEVGDVNGDGSLDVADCVAVLNAMAGKSVLGNPDVNGDGSSDVADAVAVLKLMAGNN